MQQTGANPYQKPGATVDDPGTEQFSEVRIFSAGGRLGRARYIGYSAGMTLAFYAVIAMGGALAATTGAEILGVVIVVAAAIALLAVGIMLTIQRCHDFDVSGWLSLLLIVPVAPLLFWIIPGSKGSNRYGAPTPPNSTGVVVLALLLPLLFFGGIIAAIALPAYQDYVMRARMVEEIRGQDQIHQPAGDESLDAARAAAQGVDGEVAQGDAADAGSVDQPLAVESDTQEPAALESTATNPAAAEPAHATAEQ